MNKLLHFTLINLLITGIGCHRTIPTSDINQDIIYRVTGVPKIVINETHELMGTQPLEAFMVIIEKIQTK